jgi:hypothetical protein
MTSVKLIVGIKGEDNIMFVDANLPDDWNSRGYQSKKNWVQNKIRDIRGNSKLEVSSYSENRNPD